MTILQKDSNLYVRNIKENYKKHACKGMLQSTCCDFNIIIEICPTMKHNL